MRKSFGGLLCLMVGMGLACNAATTSKPAAPPTKPAAGTTSSTTPNANEGATSKTSAVTAAVPSNAPSASGTAAAAPSAGVGVITPANTKLTWVGTKDGGKHVGSFGTFSGKIDPPGADLTASKITLDIETASLTSDNGGLTKHLKSPDFFNIDKHPKATFATTKIVAAKAGDSTHEITGDLTILGTTKSITFPAKVTTTDDSIKLESKFKINRMDYGMKYGAGKVHDDVSLEVSANVLRK